MTVARRVQVLAKRAHNAVALFITASDIDVLTRNAQDAVFDVIIARRVEVMPDRADDTVRRGVTADDIDVSAGDTVDAV